MMGGDRGDTKHETHTQGQKTHHKHTHKIKHHDTRKNNFN